MSRREADWPQLDDRERALVERARAFAADQVAPNAAQWEARREVPLGTLRAAAEAGLAGLLVPASLGGQGMSHSGAARVFEELAAADMAFAFSLVVHNNLAANIARNGGEALIARHLPGMLSAERIGAFCLTEPGAGSDAAAITTRASRDGEGWRLDGEKAWVTNGAVAEVLSVYAQTEAEAGATGIACLIVEGDAEGLTREPAYGLMGGHAMGTTGLKLAACRVAQADLLLPPGRAFKAAMLGINLARALVGAMCCGMLRASLETALDYAGARRAFGRPTTDFQGLSFMLADVATELEASRLLSYRATALLDRGESAMVEAAHAKKFATRAALKGISDCMQAMGAAGYRSDQPLGRHLACAKMAQFLDGTTEIQNVVIGRALIGGRGEGG
ncbi:MAG: acyl-CoA dehydrogenase family protein [Alphaproteobacteria bacterium]